MADLDITSDNDLGNQDESSTDYLKWPREHPKDQINPNHFDKLIGTQLKTPKVGESFKR